MSKKVTAGENRRLIAPAVHQLCQIFSVDLNKKATLNSVRKKKKYNNLKRVKIKNSSMLLNSALFLLQSYSLFMFPVHHLSRPLQLNLSLMLSNISQWAPFVTPSLYSSAPRQTRKLRFMLSQSPKGRNMS